MARTKQTARRSSYGRPPRAPKQQVLSKEDLNKKRKEFRQEREENKKIRSSHQQQENNLSSSSFEDLLIKCSEQKNGSSEDGTEINLFRMLNNKMGQHICSKKCSTMIPVINYEVLNRDDFDNNNVLLNVGACKNVSDAECSSYYVNIIFELFQEFLRERQEFEGKVIQTDSKQSVLEYRKCGKLCYYKKVGREFEIMMLLINQYEYFYVGQSGRHAFYGMPRLRYMSSSDISPNISNLHPKKVDESFVPIPFDDLLDNANDFLDKLLSGGYH